jgi:SAM-dependent methyltransferase
VGNFLGDDVPAGSFDLVFEHTCFCAIFPEERPAYARAAHHVLNPGGHLLAIFFTNIDKQEGPPFQITQSEIRALFGDPFDVVESWAPTQSYPEREGREEMWLLRKR